MYFCLLYKLESSLIFSGENNSGENNGGEI